MARSKPTIDALSKIGKEISSDAPHFRLQIPPELDGLVSDMRAMLIDIIETNPAIRSGGILRRPVYQRLLGEALRPGDPSLQMADEAIPQNPNEAVVRDEIQRIAKLISPLIVASEEDHPLPETQIAVSKGVEIILYAHLRKKP